MKPLAKTTGTARKRIQCFLMKSFIFMASFYLMENGADMTRIISSGRRDIHPTRSLFNGTLAIMGALSGGVLERSIHPFIGRCFFVHLDRHVLFALAHQPEEQG